MLRATRNEDGSWSYEYEKPGHGWVQRLVTRAPSPPADGPLLAAKMNEAMGAETAGGGWVAGGRGGLVKVCCASASDAPPEDVQVVEMGADGTASVRVTNIFRSWDRFYVTMYAGEDGAGPPTFVAEPTSGDLAPRGGANNVCDESKPYMDYAQISVRALAPGEATMLVRSEEEQWIFRLVAR